jgi:hypothetical protein
MGWELSHRGGVVAQERSSPSCNLNGSCSSVLRTFAGVCTESNVVGSIRLQTDQARVTYSSAQWMIGTEVVASLEYLVIWQAILGTCCQANPSYNHGKSLPSVSLSMASFLALPRELCWMIYEHVPNVRKHTTYTFHDSAKITVVHVVPSPTIRCTYRGVAFEWSSFLLEQACESVWNRPED